MSIILHLLVKQIADVYVSTRIVFTLTELYSVVLRWLSQVSVSSWHHWRTAPLFGGLSRCWFWLSAITKINVSISIA